MNPTIQLYVLVQPHEEARLYELFFIIERQGEKTGATEKLFELLKLQKKEKEEEK